ncbi:MAG: shikimate dehydrogenase [Candidatus Omnitrophica bacterium]|nr:shikimate dehydrogenase [Candidatus Omnitrophota bacterium]
MAGEAEVLRAVNTLLVRDGRLIGYNTDVIGFRRALEELGWTPRPCTALILGAGGTAKAVAWALSQHPGTALTIANRHEAGAHRLKRWLARHRSGCRVTVRSFRTVRLREHDLLVNATSVGMSPKDGMPVDDGALHRDLVVYDVVYNRLTPLVRAAQRRGCLAANGLSMLVYQGAEAFRLWWHREPPIDAMRRAVEEALCKNEL